MPIDPGIQACSELGGDPARLAVGGDSAGGNLAAVTSILAHYLSGHDAHNDARASPLAGGPSGDRRDLHGAARGVSAC